MAGDFVGWLLERGKAGGIGLAVLGLLLIGGTVLDFRINGGFYPAMPGTGILLLLIGIALFVLDKPALRGEFREPTARPLDVGLVQALEAEPKPYLLCMSCKKVTPFTPCMHCDRGIDVLTVESDADLALALASME